MSRNWIWKAPIAREGFLPVTAGPQGTKPKFSALILTPPAAERMDSLSICGSRVLVKMSIFRPYLSFAMPANV
jgi:hypothetical protein